MASRSKVWDIAIVGAGSAGLSAAIAAAQYGLKSIVLERGSHPPDRPGETLHPGTEGIFRQLGILESVEQRSTLRHAGIVIDNASGRHRQPYGETNGSPWSGYQIRRQVLHEILLDRIIELGGNVRFNCAAKSFLKRNDAKIIVKTEAGEIICDWIFDASGTSNWLARKDGTGYQEASRQFTACYGYDQLESGSVHDEWPIFKFEPWGWSWRAPLGDDRVAWVLLFHCRDALRKHRPLCCKAADSTWKLSVRPAYDYTFRIGDAVARMDPSAGRGVLRAMMSAIMSAHLVKAVKDCQIDSLTATNYYCQWIKTWFEADTRELRHFLSDDHIFGGGTDSQPNQ